MRLMQRLAISGLLSVILIVLLTGTFVTRRDLTSVVDRGVAPEERSEQVNPGWVQNNVVPGQDEPRTEDKDRRVDFKHKQQSEPSAVGPPPLPVPGPFVIRSPNPPLDDVTNQRREKVKEMMKHGWDNYVRYAWGKNELRPITKRGHSASIFGSSNMGATIVDGLDTLYIMGLQDEFKQGRDWIAKNLDFDIFAMFVTKDMEMHLLLEILANIFLTTLVVIRYSAYALQSEMVKKLFEEMRYDWNSAKNAKEYEILKKYGLYAKWYTMSFACATFSCLVILAILLFTPCFLDVVAPLSEPRPRDLILKFEFFLDEEEYFFLLAPAILFMCFFTASILVATESTFGVVILHGCAIYQISCYQIRTLINQSMSPNPISKQNMEYAKIDVAVRTFNRATQFVDNIGSTYKAGYFITLIFMVLSISVNFYRLCQAITHMESIQETIMDLFYVGAFVFYSFMSNLAGQFIIEHSTEIADVTYDSPWYATPVHLQKLLLFVMRRGGKESCVLLGGIYNPSLRGFATMMSSAVSYFTVLYSL